MPTLGTLLLEKQLATGLGSGGSIVVDSMRFQNRTVHLGTLPKIKQNHRGLQVLVYQDARLYETCVRSRLHRFRI